MNKEVQQLDLTAFGSLIRERRGRLSVRQAAQEADVSFSTLSRVENGAQPDLISYSKLCAWLGMPPGRFFATTAERELNHLEQAILHIRQDSRLSEEAANSIADMLRQMHTALAQPNDRQEPLVHHLRAPAMRPGVPHRLSAMLRQMHRELDEFVKAGGGTARGSREHHQKLDRRQPAPL